MKMRSCLASRALEINRKVTYAKAKAPTRMSTCGSLRVSAAATSFRFFAPPRSSAMSRKRLGPAVNVRFCDAPSCRKRAAKAVK